MVLVYTFTIFLSAALMFMVQPMIGKMILPTLGGAPAVWNTCLVFFQALLLGGYLYAHFSIKWLGHRVQSLLHIAVLGRNTLLAYMALDSEFRYPILDSYRPKNIHRHNTRSNNAVAGVTGHHDRLPFFVISTSAPLLQSWFSKTDHPSASNHSSYTPQAIWAA